MSLDTKYRPHDYADVIGQDAIVTVLRGFVRQGKGFQQSYLFSGPKGCGKTTLGRILARALLCESPVEGDPCNRCPACLDMLQDPPAAEGYVEMDAATHSGKEQVQDIVEKQRYETFSGRHRIYLVDEAHRLSSHAMDGLLKSLEDTIPGTDDKVLVCIFCTTEIDKVRNTISSRCAPTFTIRRSKPNVIAGHLASVCDKEGIQYKDDALELLAEVTECHVRDALQAVSGISMLGEISFENVRAYMRLDSTALYLEILSKLGSDLKAVMSAVEELKAIASPSACYLGLAETAMTAFRSARVGVGKIPSYWGKNPLEGLGDDDLDRLVDVALWMSRRPARPSHSMLVCDLAMLHRRITLGLPLLESISGTVVKVVETVRHAPDTQVQVVGHANDPSPDGSGDSRPSDVGSMEQPPAKEVEGSSAFTRDGVYQDPRCKKHPDPGPSPRPENEIQSIEPELARRLLLSRISELRSNGRSAR